MEEKKRIRFVKTYGYKMLFLSNILLFYNENLVNIKHQTKIEESHYLNRDHSALFSKQ